MSELPMGVKGWYESWKAAGLGTVKVRGRTVTMAAAAALMNDDLREQLHSEMAPCVPQDFVDAYAEAHREKFGEEFTVA